MSNVALGVHMFSGPFTWGLTRAGWEVPYALESSTFGAATSRANNPATDVRTGYETWRAIAREMRDVRLVAGQPACSCWSPMGRSGMGSKTVRGKDSWKTDPNLQMTVDLVAVGDAVRPELWITESVPNFHVYGAAEAIGRFWLDRGYNVSLVREDAKFFGVPQQRRRVFLVAHRVDFVPTFPPFLGFTPVGAALEGAVFNREELPPMRDEFVYLLERTPPGKDLKSAVDDGYVGRTPRFMDARLQWELPSGTIVGIDHYYHPHEHRKVTWRELAATGGYPPEWEEIAANTWMAIVQLGKVVLPPIAEWMGGQLLAAAPGSRNLDGPMMYTHWGQSTRISDFRLLEETTPWSAPNHADAGWLEERVNVTRESLGI